MKNPITPRMLMDSNSDQLIHMFLTDMSIKRREPIPPLDSLQNPHKKMMTKKMWYFKKVAMRMKLMPVPLPPTYTANEPYKMTTQYQRLHIYHEQQPHNNNDSTDDNNKNDSYNSGK